MVPGVPLRVGVEKLDKLKNSYIFLEVVLYFLLVVLNHNRTY